MLSKPVHGWSTVKIGVFKKTASYLTDVPMDLLDAFIQYFNEKNHLPFGVNFEGESEGMFGIIEIGDELYLHTELFSEETDVMRELKLIKPEDYGFGYFARPKELLRKMAEEVIADIKENLEAWVNWDLDPECDPDEAFSKRRNLLNMKIALLEIMFAGMDIDVVNAELAFMKEEMSDSEGMDEKE